MREKGRDPEASPENRPGQRAGTDWTAPAFSRLGAPGARCPRYRSESDAFFPVADCRPDLARAHGERWHDEVDIVLVRRHWGPAPERADKAAPRAASCATTPTRPTVLRGSGAIRRSTSCLSGPFGLLLTASAPVVLSKNAAPTTQGKSQLDFAFLTPSLTCDNPRAPNRGDRAPRVSICNHMKPRMSRGRDRFEAPAGRARWIVRGTVSATR
jgi:hypothetical protein